MAHFAFPISVSVYPVNRPPVNVTEDVQDLSYSGEVPGGFAACSFTLPRDVAREFDELRPFGDVVISDGSVTLYQGRIEAIGRRVGSSGGGARATVEAYGWQRHAADDVYRGIINDRRLDQWQPKWSTSGEPLKTLSVQIEDEQDGSARGPLVRVQNPASPGSITAGDYLGLLYDIPATYPGARITRIRLQWRASTGTTNRSFRIIRRASGSSATIYNTDWTTSVQTVDLDQSGAPAGILGYTIAPWYANTTHDPGAGGVVFYGTDNEGPMLFGTDLHGFGGSDNIEAHDVVDEVVKRMCPKFSRSFIQTSTGPKFEDLGLVYAEPTEPRQIFDEMLAFAPENATDAPWTWSVWEKLPDGLYRFEFGAMPTSVKFMVRGATLAEVSYDHVERVNKAVVQYYDALGKIKEVERTQTIATLSDAGVTRSATIGPISGITSALAQRVGDVLLEENRRPRRSGSVTLDQSSVVESTSGAMPIWRLVRNGPGQRIRIADWQGRDPAVDSDDDDSVFVIRSVTADPHRGTVTVALDNPPDVLDTLLARLGA